MKRDAILNEIRDLHVTAFRPISEAGHSWPYDNIFWHNGNWAGKVTVGLALWPAVRVLQTSVV